MLLLENTTQARVTLQKRAFFIAFFTLAVLFVFQPFGTYESDHEFKYLKLAGYGLATFFAVFLAGLIEIQLSKIQSRIAGYPYLVIGLYILIGAIVNHSYFVVAILEQWHWMNQLMFIVYVAAIAIFPISIVYFKEAGTAQTEEPVVGEHVKPKEVVGGQSLPVEEIKTSVQVNLTGENKSDQLAVDVSELLFIKSADNYCEVVTIHGAETNTALIRISLTKALEQLPVEAKVIRCHRSYAVNAMQVAESSGNANGMQLHLKANEVCVPVSRSYVASVKAALSVTTSA